MSTAEQLTPQANKLELKVIEAKAPKMSGAEALAEMREQLNTKRNKPQYIYDCVLNDHQRKILCFAAGLKKQHLTLAFNDLEVEARTAIRKAIFMCLDIFNSFNNSNAIETQKFFLPGEHSRSDLSGEFMPVNKLTARELATEAWQ